MNDYPPGLYFNIKVKTHPKSSGLVRMLLNVFYPYCGSLLLSTFLRLRKKIKIFEKNSRILTKKLKDLGIKLKEFC